MRALIGIGIFRQRSDGRYALTPLAETLRTDAPVSMAGMARWVGSPRASRALEPPDRRDPHRASGGPRASRQTDFRIPGRRSGARCGFSTLP